MIAPGLPEIATKYDIQSSSVVALTLSILMLSFSIGVGVISFYPRPLLTRFKIAPYSCPSI